MDRTKRKNGRFNQKKQRAPARPRNKVKGQRQLPRVASSTVYSAREDNNESDSNESVESKSFNQSEPALTKAVGDHIFKTKRS